MADRLSAAEKVEMTKFLGSFTRNPRGFVLAAYEWGIGELENKYPDPWQLQLLDDIGNGLRTVNEVIQIAIASGHGIGKSALVSWLIQWSISTFEDTKGVVTANTESQLRLKTWAELAKWHRLFIGRDLFVYTATSYFSSDKDHEKTWRIDAVPWSEHNSEAFAGLHNQGKRIILIFDEASAIANSIWEVAQGALTDADTEIIWCAFGNPTRNSGKFYDCFHSEKKLWLTKQIDSRKVAISNKTQLDKWIETYGENSDFVKVRVKGQFPSISDTQLISSDLIEKAMNLKYPPHAIANSERILAVDVARYGRDNSTLTRRQGLALFEQRSFNGLDLMELADIVAKEINEYRPDATFIDVIGIGAGVVDRLRQLGYNVTGVNFASRAVDNLRFANKRAEVHFAGKEWLEKGGLLPRSQELKEELAAIEYSYDEYGKMRIIPKDKIKELIGRSPDLADGFFLTFAHNVAPRNVEHQNPAQTMCKAEYDPFDY